MSRVIREIGVVSPCNACGKTDGVKEFQLGSEVYAAWCRNCAGKVVSALRSAFHLGPEEYPAWIGYMQNIGSTRPEGGKRSEHS